MFGIGQPEILIIIVIALLLFGSKSLPKMSHTLGESMRSLREGFSDGEDDKSFKDITKEVANSARDIRSSIDDIKKPLTDIKNSAIPTAEPAAQEQQNS